MKKTIGKTVTLKGYEKFLCLLATLGWEVETLSSEQLMQLYKRFVTIAEGE